MYACCFSFWYSKLTLHPHLVRGIRIDAKFGEVGVVVLSPALDSSSHSQQAALFCLSKQNETDASHMTTPDKQWTKKVDQKRGLVLSSYEGFGK